MENIYISILPTIIYRYLHHNNHRISEKIEILFTRKIHISILDIGYRSQLVHMPIVEMSFFVTNAYTDTAGSFTPNLRKLKVSKIIG